MMKYLFFILSVFMITEAISQNVGIGNYTPERMLDVGADGNQYARLRSTNGGIVGLELMRNGSPDDWRITNNSEWLDFYHSNNDFTSASIKFSFRSNGQLSIGHDNPLYPLDVNGLANLNRGVLSGPALLVNGDEAIWYNDNYFRWGNGGTANYFPDNVGIGTSSPAYSLDINGTANLNKNISSGPALLVHGDEAIWYNGSYFSWGYGGTANYFADNVGIGTAFPAANLHVEGDVRITSLAGTGVREMRVNADGRPFAIEEIYTVSPASFQCYAAWSGGGVTHGYIADGQFVEGNNGDDDCTRMVAGIKFNQGDIINQITLYAKDATSDRNLKVQLLQKPHLSDVATVIVSVKTAGVSTQTVTENFITGAIYNDADSYFLRVFCYNVGEDENTPVLWAPGTTLLGIVVK